MSRKKTLFERMSDLARRDRDVDALIDRLKREARFSRMTADQQLRFESMLDQLRGTRERKDPLPGAPPARDPA